MRDMIRSIGNFFSRVAIALGFLCFSSLGNTQMIPSTSSIVVDIAGDIHSTDINANILRFWVDAMDLQGTGDIVTLASMVAGSTISATMPWRDKSGNGLNLYPASPLDTTLTTGQEFRPNVSRSVYNLGLLQIGVRTIRANSAYQLPSVLLWPDADPDLGCHDANARCEYLSTKKAMMNGSHGEFDIFLVYQSRGGASAVANRTTAFDLAANVDGGGTGSNRVLFHVPICFGFFSGTACGNASGGNPNDPAGTHVSFDVGGLQSFTGRRMPAPWDMTISAMDNNSGFPSRDSGGIMPGTNSTFDRTYLWNLVNSAANNTQRILRNGDLLVSDETGHAVNVGHTVVDGDSRSRIVLGYEQPTHGQGLRGNFHEFIVFSRYLSTSERLMISSYLSAKWNLDLLGSTTNGEPDTNDPQFPAGMPNIYEVPNRNTVNAQSRARFDLSGVIRVNLLDAITVGHSAGLRIESGFAPNDMLNADNTSFIVAHNDGFSNGGLPDFARPDGDPRGRFPGSATDPNAGTTPIWSPRTWFARVNGSDNVISSASSPSGISDKITLTFDIATLGLPTAGFNSVNFRLMISNTPVGFNDSAVEGVIDHGNDLITFVLDADVIKDKFFTVLAVTQFVSIPFTEFGNASVVNITEGSTVNITLRGFWEFPFDQQVTLFPFYNVAEENYPANNSTTTNGFVNNPAVFGTTNADVTLTPQTTVMSRGPRFINRTVMLHAIDDNIFEGDEYVGLRFGDGPTLANENLNNANLYRRVFRVVDNEPMPEVRISASPSSINEFGGATTITVSLISVSPDTITVTVNLGGTAASTEYEPFNNTFVFLPGESTKQRSFAAIDDGDSDGNKTVHFNPSIASGPGLVVPVSSFTLTITDNEIPRILPTVNNISIEELGIGNFFNMGVRLNARPQGLVRLHLTASPAANVVISPSTLNFNANTWLVNQQATITAVDDERLVDRDTTITVSVDTAVTIDPIYRTMVNDAEVSVTIRDDDDSGFNIAATNGFCNPSTLCDLEVTENSSASFAISLTKQPESNVSVQNSVSNNPSEATVNAADQTLVFTPTNWAVSQTVIVNATDDNRERMDTSRVEAAVVVLSSDIFYASAPSRQVEIIVVDDDIGNLILSTHVITIEETTRSQNFSVRLGTRPDNPITVLVVSDSTAEATVSPSLLTFNPSGLNAWNGDQVVTITSVDDLFAVTDVANITLDPSGDSVYSAIESTSVRVVLQTDETAGMIVSTTTLSVAEEGGQGSFSVRLSAQPKNDIDLILESNAPQDAILANDMLIFTPTNWNTAQTATVIGVEDGVTGNHSAIISVQIDPSALTVADNIFSSVPPTTLTVTVIDNEVPGIRVSTLRTTVGENGGTRMVNVRLQVEPSADVTLSLTPVLFTNDSVESTSEMTVNPNTMGFTQTNWAVNRPLTITGVDDMHVNPDRAKVRVRVLNTVDTAYQGIPDQVIDVQVVDDEVAAILVSPPTVELDERGSTTAVTISLSASPPSGNVALDQIASPPGRISIEGSPVFNPTNALVSQTLIITAIDNRRISNSPPEGAGNARFDIVDLQLPVVFGAISYRSANPAMIRLRIRDDDIAALALSPPNLSIAEGEITTYTMSLNTIPEAAVAIRIDGEAGILYGILNTATDEIEYGPSGVPRNVIFNPQSSALTSQTVYVQAENDSIYNGPRDIVLEHRIAATDDTNYQAFGNSVLGSINLSLTSDDDLPVVSIQATTQTDESQSTTVLVTMSNPSSSPVTVRFIYSGTAMRGNNLDYTAATVVVIPDRTTGTELSFLVNDDPIYERDEIATIRIGSVSGGGAVASTDTNMTRADIRIRDNESIPLVRIAVQPVEVTEDNELAQVIAFLDRPTTQDVTVNVSAIGIRIFNSPAEPEDYILGGVEGASSVNITVMANDTTGGVTIQSRPDTESGENEDLLLEIALITGEALRSTATGHSTARFTIIEDARPPTVDGNSLTTTDATAGSVVANWAQATDDLTPINAIRYELYVSTMVLTTTDVATIRMQAVSSASVTASTNAVLTGLLPLRTYYLVLLARDLVDNVAFYTTQGVFFNTLRAIDIDEDGVADNILAADGNNGDGDGDGLSDDLESYLSTLVPAGTAITPILDSNNNRIPDAVEVALGLPVNQATAEEIIGDNIRPVITIPSTQLNIADASEGFYTDVSVQVRAMDGDVPLAVVPYFRQGMLCGGSVLPSNYQTICVPVTRSSDTLRLRSGANDIWWIAVDDDGNWPLGGASTQNISLLPQLSFQEDISVVAPSTVEFSINLNGQLVDPSRPLTIDFVSDNDSSNFVALALRGRTRGQMTISENEMSGKFVGRSTEGGVAVLRMVVTQAPFAQSFTQINSENERVLVGGKTTLIITTLQERNLNRPPNVNLTVMENGTMRPVSHIIIPSTVGVLRVLANVIDSIDDTLRYDWSATDPLISPLTESAESYNLPTSSLSIPGVYYFRVAVTDRGNQTVQSSYPLRIYAREDIAVLRTDKDVDGDSVSDMSEGIFDNDMDGIPNYLDTLTNDASALQGRRLAGAPAPDASRYLLTTDSGLRLRLGHIALSASRPTSEINSYAAAISLDDIRNYGNNGQPVINVEQVMSNAPIESIGIYNFEVTGISNLGDRIDVVLPMLAPLPVRPQYRKYRHGVGWNEFDPSAGDRVISVLGQSGICPGTRAAVWNNATALVAGHHCVRLSIADGGLNDGDGLVNGQITDPGGIVSIPLSEVRAGTDEGGGRLGVLSVLSLCVLIGLFWRRRMAVLLSALMILITPSVWGDGHWDEWLPSQDSQASRWANLYGGIGFGSSFIDLNETAAFRLVDKQQSAMRYTLGYRLSPSWSIEALSTYVGRGESEGNIGRFVYDYEELGAGVAYRLPKPSWSWRRGDTLGLDWHWQIFLGTAYQTVKWGGGELAENAVNQTVVGFSWDMTTSSRWFVRLSYEQYGMDATLFTINWLLGRTRWQDI